MMRELGRLSVPGVVFLLLAVPAFTQQDEMVANPFYKFWAASKLGATASHLEITKLSGPEGKVVPDGIDEKHITYKLVELDDKRAVVEMVVTEQDFLGYVQAAPTRYIYPAKLKKSHLERILVDAGKPGEDTVKVGDMAIKCKTVSGTVKAPGGELVDYKLWLSDEVPGSIVKHIRTAKQKGDVFAETTTTLKSFKKAN